jgi:hypothetical protein
MNATEVRALLDELDQETPSDRAVAMIGAGSMIAGALVMLSAQELPALELVHLLAERLSSQLQLRKEGG